MKRDVKQKEKKLEETTKEEVQQKEKADKLQAIHKDIAKSTAWEIVKELKENGIDAGNFEEEIADMVSASYPMVMMSLMFAK